MFFLTFLDSLTGHAVLTAYLLAVTDERDVWRRLRKAPVLLLSPLAAALLSMGMCALPELGMSRYFISSFAVLALCTLWVGWTWRLGLWQAFAVTCMAGVFQVAGATLSFWALDENTRFAAAAGLHLGVGLAGALLLYRLRFGRWFRLLLDHGPAPRRTALLLFALEAAMEVLLGLSGGLRPQLLPACCLLAAVLAALIAAVVVYGAQRLDALRRVREQRDVIARQRLYERDLEDIRREVRAFRHDYKNLLAGLAQQAGEGELEGVRRTLAELDAGFDRRLGERIRTSAQVGNVQIPEVRSLLVSKLAVMRERNVECRLEVLYPVVTAGMDVWDLTRCLGILIDNAVEAALDTERPWVEIVLLAQDGRLSLRISNPYAGPIDSERMWREGWSTRGAGRGLGLASYQRILERYSNSSPCTSWGSGVFTQELTVEAGL